MQTQRKRFIGCMFAIYADLEASESTCIVLWCTERAPPCHHLREWVAVHCQVVVVLFCIKFYRLCEFTIRYVIIAFGALSSSFCVARCKNSKLKWFKSLIGRPPAPSYKIFFKCFRAFSRRGNTERRKKKELDCLCCADLIWLFPTWRARIASNLPITLFKYMFWIS